LENESITMAEGWKQIWSDILNSIRGTAPASEEGCYDASSATPQVEASRVEDAVPPIEQTASVEEDRVESSEQSVPTWTETPPARVRNRWIGNIAWGLGIIALLAFVGRPWIEPLFAPQPPAPDVVATFKGGQITSGQLEAHLALLVPKRYQAAVRTPENLRALVEEMVVDELARRWGAERKVDSDETFRHTMQHISESINLDSLHAQMHERDIPVRESEIQAYYQGNQSRFGGKPLEEARRQIRDTLASQKEKNYLRDYVGRLKANASVSKELGLLEVPEPSDEEVRRYYDKNREQYKLPPRVVVDEIQIPIRGDEAAARKQADAVRLRLQSGATFVQASQEIAGARVITATTVISGTRSADWTDGVTRLGVGALSEVLRDGTVFSIVRLRERQPERIPALSEVRTRALAGAGEQKAEEWFKSNGDKTLFTIKGRRYPLGQFYREYKELPPDVRAQFAGAEGHKKLAEQLIERLLIVEDSQDRLLDVENKAEVEETRLDVLKQMFHQENIDDKIEISDEQIKKFYDENKSRFVRPPKARIRYIRIGLGQTADEEKRARDRANEAYRKLVPGPFQEGADFKTIAREYSEDPETATKGGELDRWIGEGIDFLAELAEHPFHEQVLSLQANQISPPFIYGGSLYIVQVIQRSEPQPIPFEQAKPMIQDKLTHRQHDELSAKLSQQLQRQAEVVIYDSTLRAFLARTQPAT
ncbi:MAG: peptidyl-prolyl cis-trans isomerase, partial [Candidatus Binatia bacterium]